MKNEPLKKKGFNCYVECLFPFEFPEKEYVFLKRDVVSAVKFLKRELAKEYEKFVDYDRNFYFSELFEIVDKAFPDCKEVK